jgi:predicted NBD/HSP70 family sugar kinase
VVNPRGHSCRCGSRGCWETEIGEPALRRAALPSVIEWLGHGVANLVNILNPEAVIFGGTLREVYRVGADEIRDRLLDTTLPAFREHLRLSVPVLGDDAPLVGAAELVFERLLDDPLGIAALPTGPGPDRPDQGSRSPEPRAINVVGMTTVRGGPV